MKPLLFAHQIQALEQRFSSETGLPTLHLMEHAGYAIADWIQARIPQKESCRIVVIAGPGSNGGDGMVVARALHQLGLSVHVFLCTDAARLKGDAKLQYEKALSNQVPIEQVHQAEDPFPSPDSSQSLFSCLHSLESQDILVDALFGIGLTRTLEEPFTSIIRAINGSKATKIAVDLPSGLIADAEGMRTKTEAGANIEEPGTKVEALRAESQLPQNATEETIVRADHTLTLGFPKVVLYTSPGFLYAGHVEVLPIGIPAGWANAIGSTTHLLDHSCLEKLRKPLHPLAHKGSHGHLFIVAGSTGKTGAALLCGQGALQTGVGLCTLAVPTHLHDVVQGRLYESMTASYSSLDELLELGRNKTAWVIGPGIPTEERMQEWLPKLLQQGEQPVVIDADALNLLAVQGVKQLQPIAKHRPLILTPHPKEAARLLRVDTNQVQQDRIGAVRKLVHLSGGTVVLKGARTLIAAPIVGSTAGADAVQVWVCPTGNPGMATAGMGDVLAGMIGALLARGWPADEAAYTAVYVHGLAGDKLASRYPVGTLLRASQLCEILPMVE